MNNHPSPPNRQLNKQLNTPVDKTSSERHELLVNATPLFGKVGTSILTIFSVVGFFGIQVVMLLVAMLVTMAIMPSKFIGIDNPIMMVDGDGTVLGVSLVFNLFAIALFVLVIIKLRKKSVRDYLKLRLSALPLKITAISFGLWIGYLIVSEAAFYYLQNQPMDFLEVYYRSADPLWLLLLGIVVLAPIYEELIFRGLIWQAIAEQFVSEKTGAIVASVVAGALFAGIHLQYDFYEIGAIFVFALILGFARYRSGSLWLPIVLHIANNGLSMAQYMWMVE